MRALFNIGGQLHGDAVLVDLSRPRRLPLRVGQHLLMTLEPRLVSLVALRRSERRRPCQNGSARRADVKSWRCPRLDPDRTSECA